MMQYENEFDSFGEQLLAIQRAGVYYNDLRVVDPRLAELNRRAQAAGGSEAVPSEGGFLIAPQFAKEIIRRMYNTGEILRRTFKMPITAPYSNVVRFPQFDESSRKNGSRLGGLQSYWQNEADTIYPSQPKFMVSELKAEKITALVYLTDELLEDSDALGRWMEYALSQELTFNLENHVLTGTGAGEPLGIMNSTALVTVSPTNGSGPVASADISNMLAAFWSASYNSPAACWLYNQALLPQLSSLTTLAGTSGGSESKVWQWRTSDSDCNWLAGLPAYMSEYCLAPGTPGDLILADLSRYVISMRGETRNDLSLDVKFLSDQAVFRSILRVNGQPIDRSPVTQLNGSIATSPFVALGTR